MCPYSFNLKLLMLQDTILLVSPIFCDKRDLGMLKQGLPNNKLSLH
jgi:hypothetical protein